MAPTIRLALAGSALLHLGGFALFALLRPEPAAQTRIELRLIELGGAGAPAAAPGDGSAPGAAAPLPSVGGEGVRERRSTQPEARRARRAIPRRQGAEAAVVPVVPPETAANEVAAPSAAAATEVPTGPAIAAMPGVGTEASLLPAGGAGDGIVGDGAGSGAAAGMGSGAGEGAGGGGSGEAGAALLSQLRFHTERCYPRAARRRRTEGVVEVRFCLDTAGHPRTVAIERSSGSRLLDEAAAGCVIEGSAPFPAGDVCVELPIAFHLD